jgi:hypothetical protein
MKETEKNTIDVLEQHSHELPSIKVHRRTHINDFTVTEYDVCITTHEQESLIPLLDECIKRLPKMKD